MIWGVSESDVGGSLATSSSSLFTLGIVGVGASSGTTAVEILASAIGLLVIAAAIGYLPTMYSSFTAREVEVSLLESRAGTPPWGPEVLARYHDLGITDQLPALFLRWEQWAGTRVETDTSYVPLIWFRTNFKYTHWISALAAVMDAAALQNSLTPDSASSETRLFLRMGIRYLQRISGAVGYAFDMDPLPTGPINLTEAEFLEGVSRLQEVGISFERSIEEAWPLFVGWRVNYEVHLEWLANNVLPPPSPWLVGQSWLKEFPG
jgi:hypothetical protein